MTTEELNFYIRQYEAAPSDYNAVAALVRAYRECGMLDEAAQFEQYLITLTPPPRKPSFARRAVIAEEEEKVKYTGPLTFTCFALSLFAGMTFGAVGLHDGMWATFRFVLAFMGLCLLCFLPAMLAEWRDVKHKWWIFVLALLLGGTIIGWFGALAWALAAPSGPRSRW